MQQIDSINYKNTKKNLDFEIVDLQRFFAATPEKLLKKDFRINFWNIIYVTKGHGVHYVDFQEYSFRAGDIIFIQKNQVHRFGDRFDVKGYIFHINEPFFFGFKGLSMDVFFEFLDHIYGSPLLSTDVTEGRTNRTLIELIYCEYNRVGGRYEGIELLATLFRSFILNLMMERPHNTQASYKSKEYELFKEYRTQVEANFMESRLVDEYANRMHVSKKSINTAVKLVSGLTAKQFIIERILLEIKRYLSQDQLMNYEIADLLGFDVPANMTKFFKHYEGISPKEFKEQLDKNG